MKIVLIFIGLAAAGGVVGALVETSKKRNT
jgi:hypothetical protein